jgi:copper(I)-binding protein
MMSRLQLYAAALLILASAGSAHAAPRVQATDAWCRPTMPGAQAAGCYVTLAAAQADSFKAVSSPSAERGEIHSMTMSGDIMRMRKLDRLDLPAGKPVQLKPGGLHIMLIRPKGALSAGGKVPLTLTFAKAPPVTVQADIRNPAPVTPMGAHHHH